MIANIYTSQQAAKLLKVDKNTISLWAYKFSGYLNPKANPPKGTPRSFEIEDLRVLAYIYMHWSEEPDIEDIKFGLNSRSHYDNMAIDDFLISITPFFSDIPENIEDIYNQGIVFTGINSFSDTFMLADSYKLAGDRLIEAALENDERVELYCPAIYNYRHATELYMKAVIGKCKRSHNLEYLLAKLKLYLNIEFNAVVPEWLENIIKTFDTFDQEGIAFRYGTGYRDEVFMDFFHIKTLMGWLCKYFRNVRHHQGVDGTL